MDASYLTTQVTNIIGQLHNLFDDIGVPSHERESKESAVRTPAHHEYSCIILTGLIAVYGSERNP